MMSFVKHAPPELLAKIRLLWRNIPAQLAKENRKFIYSALKSGARAREYEAALQWLDDAGMIRRVFRASPPRPVVVHHHHGGRHHTGAVAFGAAVVGGIVGALIGR